MKALALLTLRPDDRQVDFYRGLEADGYDLLVFVDDPDFQPVRDDVRYVLIDDAECASAGYYDFAPTCYKLSRACSWDKAAYFFARLNPVRYEHVWLIEDDVFVPTLDAISALDRKYPGADIVSQAEVINTTGTTQGWFWWRFIDADLLPLPWAMSLVCAVRLKTTVFDLLPALVDSWKARYGVPTGAHSTTSARCCISSTCSTPSRCTRGCPWWLPRNSRASATGVSGLSRRWPPTASTTR